jgi:multiple antibiotic resistance protein
LFMINEFLIAFFSIFVIMDALGNVPIYWSLSQKLNKNQKTHCIDLAVLVASIVLLVFLFLGESILTFFGISIYGFKVAGGIIILIIALEMVLGLQFKEKQVDKYQFAFVPLATPLITGPGVITTIILLTHQVGILITFFASVANLLLCWLVLRMSDSINKFMGRQGAEILRRIMGLILAAIAVEFISSGWKVLYQG